MSSGKLFKGDIGLRESSVVNNDKEPEENDEAEIFDREFMEMKVEDFEELYQDDPSIRETIELILSEYEHIKYNSMGRVPSGLSKYDMRQLLQDGPTPHQRQRLLHFFFKREMNKRQSKRKREREKEEIRLRREAKLKSFSTISGRRSGLLTEEGDIMYGLWHNSLFARIPENKLKAGLSSSRLATAALFGRQLIFDFGLDEYMLKHNCKNTAEQVSEAYGLNRFDYREPFDFWFCNFDKSAPTASWLCEKTLTNLYENTMITVKPDCMTNHFDKSRLVYLTPNAKERLGPIHKTDDVYIIGCLNDKGTSQPVTMRKAKMLGIRTRSLPIDDHILWQGPNKSLCINHVVGILLEVMSNGGDWYKALVKHIPPRKIKSIEQVKEEEQRRLTIMKKQRSKFNLRSCCD